MSPSSRQRHREEGECVGVICKEDLNYFMFLTYVMSIFVHGKGLGCEGEKDTGG